VARRPSPANVALGRAVRELRLRRNLSQEELALQSDVQRKTIYQLEGAKSDPRYGTVRRVAAALGTRFVDLIVLADELEATTDGRERVA
jgi:transcriptional regulator with XRE-family HTH domain